MPKIALYPPGSTLETAVAVTIPKCPGCGQGHHMPTRAKEGPRWSFNGDVDRPTLTPSVLATTGPFPEGDFKEGDIIGGQTRRHLNAARCLVCHFFLRDGRVQFLMDCTHDKKGQTVDLLELDAAAGTA